MQKNVVVIFIDRYLNKNILQNNIITELAFQSFWFVNNKSVGQAKNIIELQTGFLSRLKQTAQFLKKHKEKIHHVEIYPGGRFSFVYTLMARWLNLKIICVERGDLLYFKPKKLGGYSLLTRVSMYISYKLADIVWYREPYMLEKLKRIGIQETVFIHNCVKENTFSGEDKEIDFLWVNRIIPERNADWFAENLKNEIFTDTHNIILGIMEAKGQYNALEAELVQKIPTNLTLHPYTAPVEFYKKSKFFVLPATIVFANNSLLEAMSYGVVPLVSNTQSSSLIVDDGINGFIFDHNPASFLKAMIKARNMSTTDYQRMSQNAKLKIQMNFSETYYHNSLKALYDKLYKNRAKDSI